MQKQPGEEDKIERIKRRLDELNSEKQRLEAELKALEAETETKADLRTPKARFSNTDKIKIFRSLFRGREDVFPVRWENIKSGKSGYAIACENEWVRGICGKPRIKCSACENKAFLSVTDEVISFHLSGKDSRNKPFCAGVYPMLLDETCWLLAADFDKQTWREDITAFLKTCGEYGIPAYIERSRSGNGGHVWMFFHEAIPASDARKLGTALLTKTMEHHPELGFASYDRLFPSQDTLPKGGLGNLIALPLQASPRQSGNSVFVDDNFEPYPDQWEHLASVERLTIEQLNSALTKISKQGAHIGLPFSEEESSEKSP